MITAKCKFTCSSKKITGSGENQTNEFEFNAVTGEENKEFWKWTPSGQLRFSCLNPNVDFEVGKNYFLEIRLAE